MAYVEKRKDRRYRARYRDPHGQVRSQTFATKRDAERWLATVETSKITGDWVDPRLGRVTVETYARSWLATKADVARSTLGNIEGRLNKHLVPSFGPMQIAAVRPSHARTYIAELTARGLAPSTVKAIVLTTGQVFGQAVEDGIIARNPFATVALPADRHSTEQRFLTAEQVLELADLIDPRYRAAVLLAAYGGLRAGELWGLDVGRLQLLAGTLDVAVSASEAGGWHVGPTKTGKRRTLTIPRFLADELGEHLGRYPSNEWVFTTTEGCPVSHRNFRARAFEPTLRRAETLPAGLRWHDLRHTCAALLIANGRHLEEVKAYLGHSSIRVTSDRYAHLFPQARAAMADALDATFRGSVTKRTAPISRPSAAISRFPGSETAARFGG